MKSNDEKKVRGFLSEFFSNMSHLGHEALRNLYEIGMEKRFVHTKPILKVSKELLLTYISFINSVFSMLFLKMIVINVS